MTSHAILLQDAAILRTNHNGLMKILQSKPAGMPVAVIGLGHVFLDHVMRKVTLNARGRSVMTCLLPRIKLRLHDMTIHARLRVLAEI
jgi:hypothetical protein